jgi:hypothetical protein
MKQVRDQMDRTANSVGQCTRINWKLQQAVS